MGGRETKKMAINIGVEFEEEMCRLLSDNGFWAHRLSENNKGAQPFDIVAVKRGHAIAIECKVVNSNQFIVSRIEDNQRSALELFHKHGGSAWFAFKRRDDSIFLGVAMEILEATNDKMHICEPLIPFERWVDMFEN